MSENTLTESQQNQTQKQNQLNLQQTENSHSKSPENLVEKSAGGGRRHGQNTRDVRRSDGEKRKQEGGRDRVYRDRERGNSQSGERKGCGNVNNSTDGNSQVNNPNDDDYSSGGRSTVSQTLVVKNLPFHIKQEKFLESLNKLETKPISVNFHYDAAGIFRGLAFVKYSTVEQAQAMFDQVSSIDFSGRRVRVEYKRKSSKQKDLDTNDDESRAIKEELLQFKSSAGTNDLIFSAALSSHQRRIINYYADKLGLSHFSQGENSNRFIMVSLKSAGKEDSRDKSRSKSKSSQASERLPEKSNYKRQIIASIQPIRQPKGPDGSSGFAEEYRNRRKIASLAP